MAKQVYMAGPFFSETQNEKAGRLEKALEAHPQVSGFFSPRKHQYEEFELFSPEWQVAAYESDVAAIDACDVVVAIADFDNQDADSGTAWEIGYAHAKGIPVVVIKEDEAVTLNLMIAKSLTAYLHSVEAVADYDLENLPVVPYDGQVI
ncbi:nucleoside 2-deoxyribosyltransferase [Fructobacillus ficulneus]|uniref:Nucleoside deoxyribosyltransferase n=1 Tax=Fructobacillus ficulneus TaxID=157463 RepID=A0A0K8MIQ3_9LACO|nr:nucleoside 2-deoxyribosyltransferase [Fructobacillus ficulneus]GAP00436.1 nucleoside deoxyribosyltransferase [Fructobacillus ficulneus]